MGGRGWIDTGIRGETAAEAVAEAAAKAAAEAVVEAAEAVTAIVWFIGSRRSAKGHQDCLFLFSYIYRVRKVVG